VHELRGDRSAWVGLSRVESNLPQHMPPPAVRVQDAIEPELGVEKTCTSCRVLVTDKRNADRLVLVATDPATDHVRHSDVAVRLENDLTLGLSVYGLGLGGRFSKGAVRLENDHAFGVGDVRLETESVQGLGFGVGYLRLKTTRFATHGDWNAPLNN